MKITTLKSAVLAALLTTTVFAADEAKPVEAKPRVRRAFDAAAFLAPKPQAPADGVPVVTATPKPVRKVFDPTAFLAPKVDEVAVRAAEAKKFEGYVSAADRDAAVAAAVAAEAERVQRLFAGYVSAADCDAAVAAEAERVQRLFAGHVAADIHAGEVAAKEAAEDNLAVFTNAINAFKPFLKRQMADMAASVTDVRLTELVAALSKEDPARHLDALKVIDTREDTIKALVTNPKDGLVGDDSELHALLYTLSLLDALTDFGAVINA
jgi:hypothetical protein